MLTEKDSAIAQFFNDCADKGFMEEFDEEELRKLERCLTKWDIKEGDKVYEPGCGTGRLTSIISKIIGENGKILASDISERMISLARKRNLNGNIEFSRNPVTSIPVENEYFDISMCFQVFPHFSDRVKALRELYRVLKPNGVMWIEHLASKETVNKRHLEVGHVVVSHMIPEENDMRKLLTEHNFAVEEFVDNSQIFSLKARKMLSR